MQLIPSSQSVCQNSPLLALPAEIRMTILEYLFSDNPGDDGFSTDEETGMIILNDDFSSARRLQPLLACRQMYEDGNQLAFERTNFIMTSLYGSIPTRLVDLREKQVDFVRNIAFVADAKSLRDFTNWGQQPFNVAKLRLDTLTIVLHRSSFWHYLFDYTSGVVKVLRNLQGVKRFVIVRNNARVKGSFKTWYNRLVGVIMKVDHQERFERSPSNLEQVWWKWSFDGVGQRIVLEALPPKPAVDEKSYLESILPLMEELRLNIENEEWNPDPRSRNMYY